MQNNRIGFGGSCHWCTEAVFQSLKGVSAVEQGWIAAREDEAFHEAVIVNFDSSEIPLKVLIEVHLRTHSSTSEHVLRKRYRSAVYVFSKKQKDLVDRILQNMQKDFDETLITRSYYFKSFKTSDEAFLNYYKKNPDKPFCKSYIDPKLKLIYKQFGDFVNFD